MNFKNGALAFTVLAVVGMFSMGCGTSHCDDLRDCCVTTVEKAGGVASTCDVYDSYDDEDACEAAMDGFTACGE